MPGCRLAYQDISPRYSVSNRAANYQLLLFLLRRLLNDVDFCHSLQGGVELSLWQWHPEVVNCSSKHSSHVFRLILMEHLLPQLQLNHCSYYQGSASRVYAFGLSNTSLTVCSVCWWLMTSIWTKVNKNS